MNHKIKMDDSMQMDSQKMTHYIDGDLALALDQDFDDYMTPELKIKKLEALKAKLVMGCWQANYQSNDGDGC